MTNESNIYIFDKFVPSKAILPLRYEGPHEVKEKEKALNGAGESVLNRLHK